eukprot:Gregarina_sp_Pseudo_9__139@NODE_1096_length_1880_cov_128_756111_g1024_i0_p5_GENE_NODE_1096_length_1880_cov_128_756111_g1024_i0NODE_1096_length_1880_cov_128_756111_g1024_i0_p5_ORF_typecomplete_len114_score20_93Ribosomal_L35Ae/PF01247_18/5_3e34RimM/PF01782_18/0_33RimM/PF01782_18/5_5_NODE_1096_length_1880_cov_128_756111_g1024_i014281769
MAYPTTTKKQEATKPRLFSKAVILSYKRSRLNVHPNTILVRIEGVQTRQDTKYYMGKRIAYLYKCNGPKSGKKVKCVWGKVTAAHGNSGVVRTKFTTNLCGDALGKPCRVYMF